MFVNRASPKYNAFEARLVQYLSIVSPFGRSLWSLEAAHTNASNICIFWLAIAAVLQALFGRTEEDTGISDALAEEVTAIYNSRYKEFFKNDAYFVTFALDPRACMIISDQIIFDYA